jgi:hypothetical protein
MTPMSLFLNLRKFKTEFEKHFWHESGVLIGSIHEENQRPEILCYCSFKG